MLKEKSTRMPFYYSFYSETNDAFLVCLSMANALWWPTISFGCMYCIGYCFGLQDRWYEGLLYIEKWLCIMLTILYLFTKEVLIRQDNCA